MTAGESLAQRRDEFKQHVWNHSVDPFQTNFDFRRPLSESELVAVRRTVRAIGSGLTDEQLAESMLPELQRDDIAIIVLMQLVGLTRSKILSDLRAATAALGVSVPSHARLLPRRPAVWPIAGTYLAKWLRGVFEPIATQGDKDLDRTLEALNQATWPGWIRQERAKRQGHEAEHRLATLFAALELPFAPQQKADNPLCSDFIVHAVSFDLVVPDVTTFTLCVKSTVQTSNIGQFGESKGALEVREAAGMLESHYSAATRPLLLAMVDGVGFWSNRAGLDGILEIADEFCQFATVWKAAVLAARAAGADVTVHLPDRDAERHADFLGRYSVQIGLLDQDARADLIADGAVEAGEALITRA